MVLASHSQLSSSLVSQNQSLLLLVSQNQSSLLLVSQNQSSLFGQLSVLVNQLPEVLSMYVPSLIVANHMLDTLVALLLQASQSPLSLVLASLGRLLQE